MSLDAALEDLARARPGWGWSVCDYQHSGGSCTAFLHDPYGGCVHAVAKTPAEAIHAAIALTDDELHEARRRREREDTERAEYERLKAKYGPTAGSVTPASADIAKDVTAK